MGMDYYVEALLQNTMMGSNRWIMIGRKNRRPLESGDFGVKLEEWQVGTRVRIDKVLLNIN